MDCYGYVIAFYVDFGSDKKGPKAKKIEDKKKIIDFDVWIHITVKQLRKKYDDQHADLLIQVNDHTYININNNNIKDTRYSRVMAYTGGYTKNYKAVPIKKLRMTTQEIGKFNSHSSLKCLIFGHICENG